MSESWRGTWRWIGWPLGLALGLTLRRILRRRVRIPAPPTPVPSAVLRLQALDPAAPQFPGAFNEILREWLAVRAGDGAPGRLAEEMLTAEHGLEPSGRDRLLDFVRHCQEARYGGRSWPLEARRQAVAGAVAIVQEAS